MKRALMILACVGFLAPALPGCYSANLSGWGAIGSDHRVTVYSGGQPVRTFRSSGKVLTQHESDGWYFTNKETGKLVRVSGTVMIEQE